MADALTHFLGSTAREFTLRRFGTEVFPQESRPTIGTSASPLLSNNPRRVFLLVVNPTGNTVAIGFKSNVTTTIGIPIAPLGGTLTMEVQEDAEAVAWELWAISSANATQLYVLEIAGK